MLRALFLDLMDTLITDPYRAALRAGTGLELAELGALRDPQVWPAFEVAAIDEREFVRRFFLAGAASQPRLDIAAFHRVRRAGYAFLPGMEAILDDTAGRVQRHLASNYPAWITEVIERFALDERLDGVHVSHDLGVRKPAEAFYHRMVERVGLPAKACLFVDDRPENCSAAEAAGLHAHLFVGADDLRRRLVAEGVLAAAA